MKELLDRLAEAGLLSDKAAAEKTLHDVGFRFEPSEYDAGPAVWVNGYLIAENLHLDDIGRYRLFLRRMKGGWAIFDWSNQPLNRTTDEFDYLSLPSHRELGWADKYRFESLAEASEFLDGWRERELVRYREFAERKAKLQCTSK